MAITGLVIWTKYLLWFHLSQTGNRKVTSSFLDFWMILTHDWMAAKAGVLTFCRDRLNDVTRNFRTEKFAL